MTETVTYTFHETKEVEAVVKLDFDDETFLHILPSDTPKPDWAKLECSKCPNCNIDAGTEYCPAALSIANFLPDFANAVSHTQCVVKVETVNRIIVSKSPIQYGIASLLGLSMASSGCPRTAFLRPMARFHLPFPDQKETVSRSLGTWLLTEYIKSGASGKPAALSFDGLKEAYAQVSIVNTAMAERLQNVVKRDAAINAIVILDAFALVTPDNLENEFADIANFVVT